MNGLTGEDIIFQHEFNNKFNDAYRNNPKKTLKLMEECIRELNIEENNTYSNNTINNSNNINSYLSVTKNRIIIYVIVGIITLICSMEGFMLGLFSCAFFISGHCIALSEKGKNSSDLIFLFSHGLSGLILLYVAFIGPIFQNIFSTQLYSILFIISIICGICGFIRTFLIRLSTTMVPYKDTVFIFYLIGFICLAIIRVLVFIETGGILYEL